MLVVLTIIGLIMGMVGPRVLGALSDSKVKTTRIEIENLTSAVDMFYLDAGRYPLASEGLGALFERPQDLDDWHGPYLKGDVAPRDPWGHPFVYRASAEDGEPFEIVSVGQDGKSEIRGLRQSGARQH